MNSITSFPSVEQAAQKAAELNNWAARVAAYQVKQAAHLKGCAVLLPGVSREEISDLHREVQEKVSLGQVPEAARVVAKMATIVEEGRQRQRALRPKSSGKSRRK